MSSPAPLCCVEFDCRHLRFSCPAVNPSETTYLVRLLVTCMFIFAIYMHRVLNVYYIYICTVYKTDSEEM